MYDILSIGDTTTDIFLDVDQASIQCDINKENCILCINYADKIPVRSITKLYGVGNAANNAVGSARLGLKTALYTIVGKDLEGKNAVEKITQDHVADEFVVFDQEKGTNHSTVVNFDGERTILVFHEPRTYKFPKNVQTKWIYFTSVAHGSASLHEEVVAYVKETGTKLGFNPGTFQMNMGLKKLSAVLEVTDILFVNKHEAQRLLDTEETDIFSLASGLHQRGPQKVVITDGPNGSYYYAEDKKLFLGTIDAPVVERTGCGDAFASACLAAILRGETPEEALRWGTANATSVLQKIGAQAGLLTEKEIEDMLMHVPDFHPKVM